VYFLGWAFMSRRLSWRRAFTLSVSVVCVLSSERPAGLEFWRCWPRILAAGQGPEIGGVHGWSGFRTESSPVSFRGQALRRRRDSDGE
jgi:hypothetical protein